jgi:hypothetical protein
MILTVYPSPPAEPSGGRVPLSSYTEKVYAIASSNGRDAYLVKRLPDGRWYCPCKGFEYRDDCRHVSKAQILEAQERGSG